MTKKILICCSRAYWHYPKGIAAGFRAQNCDVHLLEYPSSSILKLERQSIFSRLHPLFQLTKINKKILRAAKSFSPDLVLIVNGEEILPKTIRTIAQKTTVVHWAVDGIQNLKTHVEIFSEYSKNFVFEPADTTAVPRAEYLPLGADLNIFYPRKFQREIDVSFVGAPHPTRLPFLEKIAANAREKFKFRVFGPFQKIDKNAFPQLAACIAKSEKLSPSEIAEIYSKSKISLNPHHEQSKLGVNPRVFEMSACETFQLCSPQKYLEKFFPNGEIETYENAEDCLQKIEFFLKNPDERERRAKTAAKIVRENFTLKHCAEQILRSIFN